MRKICTTILSIQRVVYVDMEVMKVLKTFIIVYTVVHTYILYALSTVVTYLQNIT